MSVLARRKLTCRSHELPVHRPGPDDVVRDVVEDRQVGARLEDHRGVREFGGPVLVGREGVDADVLGAEAAVGDPGPEDRMHLRHVRAPEHEGVGVLEVVVAAHRLVRAEGADEGDGRRRHAVPGVRVEVVGAEAAAHQLGRGVALEHRPLAGAEHADRLGALLAQHLLPVRGHGVEGLVPGDRLELAVLGEAAVPHPHERAGEPVRPVHDLGKEVALHAVEAAIDLGAHVAMRRHHAPVLHGHHDAAAGAAEAARRLRPFEPQLLAVGDVLRLRRERDVRSGRGRGGGLGLDQFAAREVQGC